MLKILFKLTENDKRVILAILLLVILVFVIIGFIGSIIVRVMKYQGKKLDTMCHDAVVAKVIKDEKHFKRYARMKNRRAFIKESKIPLLIILLTVGAYFLTCLIRKEWFYDIIDYEKTGIGTLFYIWDFSDCYSKFFGINLLSRWPTSTINTPHFEIDAIASYAIWLFGLVGGIWYLITVQRFISRLFRIHHLANSIYSKSLENYNKSKDDLEKLKAEGKI